MEDYTSASGRLIRLIVSQVASAGAASFRETFEQALALPMGAYFSSAATGRMRLYKRVPAAPGYNDLGDTAATLFAETAKQFRDEAAQAAEQAALSAQESATAVQDRLLSLPTDQVLAGTELPDDVRVMRTEGRTAAGDGGGGVNLFSIVEPDHPGKIQDGGGNWWEFLDEAPNVERFLNIDDAQQWSAYSRRPVNMRPETDYRTPGRLVMQEGAKLICAEGDYNFVTFRAPMEDGGERLRSMARILPPDGLDQDFLTFGADAYNAFLGGVYIDARQMTGGAVVAWEGADWNPRTQATLRHVMVRGYGAGVGVHVPGTANEPKLHKVTAINCGTGFLFEGGDIEANFVSAPYNDIGIHMLATRGRLRSLALEAWECERNFLLEGAIADADITSLISDTSGRHGVEVRARAGEPAPRMTIERLQISNSAHGDGSDGLFDDYFEDFSAAFSEAGRIKILAANMTGGKARYRVNGVYNANNGFNAMAAPSCFRQAELSSGAGEALSLAARKHVDLVGWEFYNGTYRPLATVGSPTGWHNLIANGDFDLWAAARPLDIAPAGSAVLARETDADFVVGTGSSLKITAGASVGDGAEFFVPNAQRYRGKVMTALASVLTFGVEATEYNTRVQVHVNGSLLVDADGPCEQIIQPKSGFQQGRVAFLVPDDAEFISLKVTPAAVAAAPGRSIWTDKWSLFEGAATDMPVPAHPMSDTGWTDYALEPFEDDLAAIDLRFCGDRIKLSAAAPVKLVGLSNRAASAEITVEFQDSNVTLMTFSDTLKRADGLDAPFPIPAGAVLKFVLNGSVWKASMPETQQRALVPTLLGAVGDGASDADQVAFQLVLDKLAASRAPAPGYSHGYTDVTNGVLIKPGTYNLGDFLLADNQSVNMVAEVDGTVTIMVPADKYFMTLPGRVNEFKVQGIKFVGGRGAFKFSNTGNNVNLLHIFKNCRFIDYSECAVQNSSDDHPGLTFEDNVLSGAEGHETVGLAWGGFLDSCAITNNNFLRNAYHLAIGPRLSGTARIEGNGFLSFGDPTGINRTKADIWIKPNVDAGGFGVNSGFATLIRSNKFGNENQLASSPRILIANEGGPGSGGDRGTQRPATTDIGYVSGLIFDNNRFSGIGGLNAPLIRSYITTGLRQISWKQGNKFDGGTYTRIVEFANAKPDADYADTNSMFEFGVADVAAGSSPPAYEFSNAHFAHLYDRACFWPGDPNAVEVYPTSTAATLLASALNPVGIDRNGSTTLINRVADPAGGTDVAIFQSGANEPMLTKTFTAPAVGGMVWIDLMLGRAASRALDAVKIEVRNFSGSRFAFQRHITVPANISRVCVPMLIPPMANPADWQLRILPIGYASGTKDRVVTGWWTISSGPAPISRKAALDRWPLLPPNRAMLGAVAGTPGTLPLGWSAQGSGGLAGISTSVIKAGADANGPFIDLRVNGTATTGGLLYISYAPMLAIEHDGSSSSWAHEVALRLIAGGYAGLTSTTTAGEGREGGTSGPIGIGIRRLTDVGGYISEVEYFYTPTTDYALYGKPDITSSNAGTKVIQPVIQLVIPVTGTAIDFTLRIYAPQFRRIT